MYVYTTLIYILRYLKLAKTVCYRFVFISKNDNTHILRFSPLLLVQSRPIAFQPTVYQGLSTQG